MTSLLRLVVLIVGAALLVSLVLVGVLTYAERPVPDVLVGLVGSSVGLLAGLLSPRPDLVVSARPDVVDDEGRHARTLVHGE